MAWSSDLFLNHGRLAVVATSTMDATSKLQPVPKVPNFLHTSSSSHKLGQVLQNQTAALGILLQSKIRIQKRPSLKMLI